MVSGDNTHATNAPANSGRGTGNAADAKSSNGGLLIIMLFIFILLVGGLLVYYFVIKNRNTSEGSGNNSGKTSLGAACTANSDCQSGNCSLNFCQSANITTGTAEAACISTNGTIANGGCGSYLYCDIARGQTVGICKSTRNTGYFDSCQDAGQCMVVNTCRAANGGGGVSGTGAGGAGGAGGTGTSYCLFPENPNACSNGTCLSGFNCLADLCLSEVGLLCSINEQCSSGSCQGGSSIVQWDGTKWSQYGVVQTGVNFTRIVATTGNLGDDIWGFDPNNGLYYQKNGQTQFIQILPITVSRIINSSVQGGPTDLTPRTMTLIDFAATTDGEVFVLFSASSTAPSAAPSSTSSGASTVYPVFTVDLTGKLTPFITSSGVQRAPNSATYSSISTIDVVKGIDNGTPTSINLAINGTEPNSPTPSQYFLSVVSSSSSTNPSTGDITVTTMLDDTGQPITLDSATPIRYVMNPNLASDVIGTNVSTLSTDFSFIECLSCDSYTGQPSGTSDNLIGESDLEILDYYVTLVTSGKTSFNNTYLLAKNSRGVIALYVAPGIISNRVPTPITLFSILPGYYDENCLVTANGPNLYVYGQQSCSG